MKFSKRTAWKLEPNPLSQKIQALRAAGHRLWDLTVTNPTQCGFDYLAPELLEAFQDPCNLIYDPEPRGLLQTRETLCAFYAKQGIQLDPDQIFLTASTSEAYSFIFRLLADPGDGLWAPSPSYPLLEYLTGLHDMELHRYPLILEPFCRVDPDFFADADFLEAKALLVVHPNNPTGNYLQSPERQALIRHCAEARMALISDEVFYAFPLESPEPPAPSLAHTKDVLTFTLGGISKLLGLPQMKLSWIIVTGPAAEVREAMARLEVIADTYLSAGTPVQNALESWMAHADAMAGEIRSRTRENLKTLKAAQTGDLKWIPPQGGWSAVLALPDAFNDEDWAMTLAEKAGVIVHPGYLYDFEEGAYAVVSLLTPPAVFAEGLERLRQSLIVGRPGHQTA
jgi:aspartate/methionine/tyrosine aminotransferase